MLEEVLERLERGVSENGFVIRAQEITRSKSSLKADFEIDLETEGERSRLLFIKVFYGTAPYRPWVELFGIPDVVSVGGDTVQYFDSPFEDRLLGLFSNGLPPAGALYVEYRRDLETRRDLFRGFPPAVTRLGYKLFKLGFTWFKVWYFPEGGSEGGEKLQAEKPLNRDGKKRQIRAIRDDAEAFLEKSREGIENDSLMKRAVERAREILSEPNASGGK